MMPMIVYSSVPHQYTYCHWVLRVNPPRVTFLWRWKTPHKSSRVMRKMKKQEQVGKFRKEKGNMLKFCPYFTCLILHSCLASYDTYKLVLTRWEACGPQKGTNYCGSTPLSLQRNCEEDHASSFPLPYKELLASMSNSNWSLTTITYITCQLHRMAY